MNAIRAEQPGASAGRGHRNRSVPDRSPLMLSIVTAAPLCYSRGCVRLRIALRIAGKLPDPGVSQQPIAASSVRRAFHSRCIGDSLWSARKIAVATASVVVTIPAEFARWLCSVIAPVVHDKAGATATMLAIALPGLIGIGALGAETGAWFTVKLQNQAAADSAAVAAAYEIIAGKPMLTAS